MRLTQVAPVWAMGVTRLDLAKLEVGRSILLAALTAIIALPLGIGLAWVLLAVVNVEAFGWRLPMYLFPSEWLRLAGLALLAAALAAALPAMRLARLSPAQLLKVFADER
jgi:putative ABC transport system permease protein